LDDEFYGDYAGASQQAQKAVDKFIDMILATGRFPNSMQLHKIHKLDLWSVYITASRQAWRILLWVNDNGSITFHRLMNHDSYMKYLKSLLS